MSILSWAWFAVAVVLALALVFVCVVLLATKRVLDSTSELIKGVTNETVPLIAEVGTTVSTVNAELGHVDGILGTAEGVTASVGTLVQTVSSTMTSPLVKGSAIVYGVRRALLALAAQARAGKRGGGSRR